MIKKKKNRLFSATVLHEMSKPVFWENKKKNIIYLSSAELAQRVVKVKYWDTLTSHHTCPKI